MKRFDEFWRTYPRKVAKGAARRAWDKAVKVAKPEQIIMALQMQVAAGLGKERMYTPYPATWLNGERWEDEILPPEQSKEERAAGRKPVRLDFEIEMLRESLADARRLGDRELERRVLAEATRKGIDLENKKGGRP